MYQTERESEKFHLSQETESREIMSNCDIISFSGFLHAKLQCYIKHKDGCSMALQISIYENNKIIMLLISINPASQ